MVNTDFNQTSPQTWIQTKCLHLIDQYRTPQNNLQRNLNTHQQFNKHSIGRNSTLETNAMSEIFTRRFNSTNRSKCVVLLHTTFSALHSILYQFIGSLLRYQQRNNKFNCTLSFCILWPHALLCMQILCLLRGVNNLISVLMLHRTALNPHTVSSKWGANLNDDPLRSTAETEIRPTTSRKSFGSWDLLWITGSVLGRGRDTGSMCGTFVSYTFKSK